MFDIQISGQILEIDEDQVLEVEFNNPIFNTEVVEGTFSLDFLVKMSPKNKLIFGFLNEMDTVTRFTKEFDCLVLLEGEPFLTGKLVVKKSASNVGFQCYVLAGTSQLANTLKTKTLRDIPFPDDGFYNMRKAEDVYDYDKHKWRSCRYLPVYSDGFLGIEFKLDGIFYTASVPFTGSSNDELKQTITELRRELDDSYTTSWRDKIDIDYVEELPETGSVPGDR